MGDIDINAARALCDAATPGPWVVEKRDNYPGASTYRIADCERFREYRNSVSFGEDKATAEFIAAARTLVPALLDRLAVAEDRARKAEEAVQRVEALLPDDPTRNASWVSTDELAWALRGSDV